MQENYFMHSTIPGIKRAISCTDPLSQDDCLACNYKHYRVQVIINNICSDVLLGCCQCLAEQHISYRGTIRRNASSNWKEGNVLFNDALHTFYLRFYGVRYMVKNHSDSERGNPLPPHGLLFSITSKGCFICITPQTG